MIVILLGPPGAGKGTQATRIHDRYGLPHISTGDLFREALAEDSDLGRKVKSYLDAGQLVPDEATSAVVAQRIDRPDCENGFMLDGFPRTLGQVSALDGLLRERRLRLDAALFFEVTEATSVERLSGRLLCEACGAGFHRRNIPPRREGVCDNCGGKLVQRTDDRPETVKERLRVYAAQTSALAEEYRCRGLLRRVNADEAPEDVAAAVFDILDSISVGSGV